MKILLMWVDKYSKSYMFDFFNAFKKDGHEIPYWVGTTNEDGTDPVIPGTIYHNHFAAWAGAPAEGFNPNEFPPPGKSLIEKMYKTESIILTMMNKKYDALCIDERRHIYYQMLGYWYGVMKKYKPEAIIYGTIPHTVYNYIIYDLAKLLGIKTVMFDDIWIGDRVLMYTDWKEGSVELKNELERSKDKKYSVNDLSDDLKEYYKQQTDIKKDIEPVYMTYYRNNLAGTRNIILRRIKIAVESFKNGTFFTKIMKFVVKRWKENLKKEYEKIQKEPDFSKNFIYVALGFQPEMVNSPMGDMFSDQILMIETLSAALPKGWKIYVKEHPGQWWLRLGINYSSNRYRGYYKKITQLSNVHIVPIDTNTFSLTKHSKAVAVVTGSPGWEAILRSKPALIFGYPWYRDCHGVFRVDSTETCKDTLEKISNGFKVNQDKIINYLKCLDSVSIRAHLEVVPTRQLKLTKEEAMKNISKAILSEIEKT